MSTAPADRQFGEPILTTRVEFPAIETDLNAFRDYFNRFSPPIHNEKGVTPIRVGQVYEVSLIPILTPTKRSALTEFIISKGGIFTGIEGLLHFHYQDTRILSQYRGMYVVSMINDTKVRDFPRITIPKCPNAPPNFGYHEIHTANDFYNSTIALLFKEVE